MKFFITGANGFVGKELIKILKKKGKKFCGVDTNKEKNPNIYKVDMRGGCFWARCRAPAWSG